ncbi:MAG TPA: hypothetical protein VMR95_00920, partial [Candidatus Binatia bacterium]|nr:hypothetical protein [Candidatus Binatia bacterium]
AFLVITLFSVGLVYLPATQHLLKFTALSWHLMAITVGLTLIYFLAIDTVKVWFYKTSFGSSL